ncbi:MAG TPA: alginate lyase family protein [Phycisphaerae bacterium]|nr:alginate lyase family protein [Phycisphaerae bacterium]
MQTVSWYWQRLASMSSGEILWRLGGAAQNTVDALLVNIRGSASGSRDVGASAGREILGCAAALGNHWADSPLAFADLIDSERLKERARAIVGGEYLLLGEEPISIGHAVNWNFEYRSRVAAPTRFSGSIDYRDVKTTGDCKWIWELNRHHHLVVLGRAYRATGGASYADAVVAHLRSWLDQCPYGRGMNWRSSLEIAIRLINWVWALELIRPAGNIEEDLSRRLAKSAYRHLWEIQRKYSRYSSANNHVIGEAAGVYIGAAYFSQFRNANRWRRRAKEILCGEILRQTHDDGVNKEQATGYQLFVMQFFTLMLLVSRNIGEDFPLEFRERLHAMYRYIAALCEGGPMPLFGDSDEGYVLDLGGAKNDPRSWLNVGAALFDDASLAGATDRSIETTAWLVGHDAARKVRQIAAYNDDLVSRVFPEGGIVLLQCGHRSRNDAISATFDCGALGFGSLAAHGHADALAVTLRVAGLEFLVDPGTFDYFSFPAWRRHFRSTRAHNTVEIDGKDQSAMAGPFLWGRQANVRLMNYSATPEESSATGDHDGYCRSRVGVSHRRTILLQPKPNSLEITDELIGHGVHSASLAFHFAPECIVHRKDSHTLDVHRDGCHVQLSVDPATELRIHRGDDATHFGNVSRNYHVRSPSVTAVASCKVAAPATLRTRISVLNFPAPKSVTSTNRPGYNGQSDL